VLLSKRVFVSNIRVLNTVQQHVHAADAQHCGVEVVAVEHRPVEVLALRLVVQRFLVPRADVLGGGNQEAGRATCRVADLVAWLGLHHLDH
jgi:hypothetical protein